MKKKIIIWAGITAGSFIVLVSVFFIVLSLLNPVGEDIQSTVEERNLSVSTQMNKLKVKEIDSLTVCLEEFSNGLSQIIIVRDSLFEQISLRDSLIVRYENDIKRMNADVAANKGLEVSTKELAKTFETMKTQEMKPILKNVDNEVVVAIYSQMNSRTRKNILMALTDKRAGAITQLLASSQTTKKASNSKTLLAENN